MRIFLNAPFRKFLKSEAIDHDSLCSVVRDVEAGRIEANLGGGVYKQRMARPGHGKSGGFRTLIIYRERDRLIFVFGFAKNDLSNLSARDLRALKLLAKELLLYDQAKLDLALGKGALHEIFCPEAIPQRSARSSA